MIHTPFKHLFLVLIVVVFSSCNWLETETTIPSSNPTFLALSFSTNDSVPALSTAKFSLVKDTTLGDSVIVNLDSLPYQTNISKVIPKFTFYSTGGYKVYLKPTLTSTSDSIILTGNDTLDFNKVLKIKNIAADGVKSRTYFIKVNVHQVRPELYQWNKVVANIFTHAVVKQKALLFKESFFLYVSSGTNNYVYTSSDAKIWVDKTTSLVGFPADCNMRDMIEFNSKLYVISSDNKLYTSSDGYSWSIENTTISDTNFTLSSILYIYKLQLWSIVKSKVDNSYHFATSTDAKSWTVNSLIPVNFPIRDFTSLSFTTRTKLPKSFVSGGYNSNGELLKNVWSTENGINWLDFSTNNSTHGFIAGSSVIQYDNKLFLFGGTNKLGKVIDKPYLQSIDEGLSWSTPDTTYNRIRQLNVSSTNDTTYIPYEPRAYQSVITRDNNIYLIGGINTFESMTYSDVWVGKLNRLNFLRQ